MPVRNRTKPSSQKRAIAVAVGIGALVCVIAAIGIGYLALLDAPSDGESAAEPGTPSTAAPDGESAAEPGTQPVPSGGGPRVEVAPGSVCFGEVSETQDVPPRTVSVRNAGTGVLVIRGLGWN